MEPTRIGTKEALVLTVLTEPLTITEIAARLAGEQIDDAAVYLALKRLTDRGLLLRRTITRRAADGKMRDVGEYRPTAEAAAALESWIHEVEPVTRRWRPAGATT
jgi:predicted transcriptional regulator